MFLSFLSLDTKISDNVVIGNGAILGSNVKLNEGASVGLGSHLGDNGKPKQLAISYV